MRNLIEIEGSKCTSYFGYFNFCMYAVALCNLEFCFEGLRSSLPAFPFFFLNTPQIKIKAPKLQKQLSIKFRNKKTSNFPNIHILLQTLLLYAYEKTNSGKRHPIGLKPQFSSTCEGIEHL